MQTLFCNQQWRQKLKTHYLIVTSFCNFLSYLNGICIDDLQINKEVKYNHVTSPCTDLNPKEVALFTYSSPKLQYLCIDDNDNAFTKGKSCDIA